MQQYLKYHTLKDLLKAIREQKKIWKIKLSKQPLEETKRVHKYYVQYEKFLKYTQNPKDSLREKYKELTYQLNREIIVKSSHLISEVIPFLIREPDLKSNKRKS